MPPRGTTPISNTSNSTPANNRPARSTRASTPATTPTSTTARNASASTSVRSASGTQENAIVVDTPTPSARPTPTPSARLRGGVMSTLRHYNDEHYADMPPEPTSPGPRVPFSFFPPDHPLEDPPCPDAPTSQDPSSSDTPASQDDASAGTVTSHGGQPSDVPTSQLVAAMATVFRAPSPAPSAEPGGPLATSGHEDEQPEDEVQRRARKGKGREAPTPIDVDAEETGGSNAPAEPPREVIVLDHTPAPHSPMALDSAPTPTLDDENLGDFFLGNDAADNHLAEQLLQAREESLRTGATSISAGESSSKKRASPEPVSAPKRARTRRDTSATPSREGSPPPGRRMTTRSRSRTVRGNSAPMMPPPAPVAQTGSTASDVEATLPQTPQQVGRMQVPLFLPTLGNTGNATQPTTDMQAAPTPSPRPLSYAAATAQQGGSPFLQPDATTRPVAPPIQPVPTDTVRPPPAATTQIGTEQPALVDTTHSVPTVVAQPALATTVQPAYSYAVQQAPPAAAQTAPLTAVQPAPPVVAQPAQLAAALPALPAAAQPISVAQPAHQPVAVQPAPIIAPPPPAIAQQAPLALPVFDTFDGMKPRLIFTITPTLGFEVGPTTVKRLTAPVSKTHLDFWKATEGVRGRGLYFQRIGGSQNPYTEAPLLGTAVEGFLNLPPDTVEVGVGEPKDPSKGPTNLFFINGIPQNLMDAIERQQVLSTMPISIIARSTAPRVTGYLGIIEGLRYPPARSNDVLTYLKLGMRENVFFTHRVMTHSDALTAANLCTDKILNTTIASTRIFPIQMLVKGAMLTCWQVYIDPTTHDEDLHDEIREGFAFTTIQSFGSFGWVHQGEVVCPNCSSLGHPVVHCPLPATPGWMGESIEAYNTRTAAAGRGRGRGRANSMRGNRARGGRGRGS
ncbi:hypothetical protein C8R43DRAFT_1119713 [Mycena crocata]|nr:hypothetical protein C8R43DRAFT_1119713 [Mycena crocata]